MFEGKFECLGENTKKYIIFSVPIEKEVINGKKEEVINDKEKEVVNDNDKGEVVNDKEK